MILDSSFVIDLMKNDEGAVEKAAELEEGGTTLRVPTMTVAELYVGVGYSEEVREEADEIDRAVGSKPTVDMNDEIAKEAGRMIGGLKREGEPVGRGDAVIGATASVRGEPVLTRNTADFERLGVEVERYR
ncbi:PIN domain-containing protein [Haladaptatus sp. F3-133]|jgi:tRNA(fMet)-specific endonuclease VapC|uniref:Ribonuclease VapC n=1 Tax=Halorutilus salinus TaxID=2487751 RepID=A0A9Q4C403_9EURY|nr:PIN domain-containing protein [Halorutilus salinus]MCX2818681.1 PIN domain-containing protein [Halorutilus salinus]